MNKTLKHILYVLPFVLFFIVVLNDRFFNKNKNLLLEHSLDIEVNRKKDYKGIIILKDTIAILQNTKRVFPDKNIHHYKNYYKNIKSVNTPYHLFKEKDNDTIIIIKDRDSFFYKLQTF